MSVYNLNLMPGPWRVEELIHGRWVLVYRNRNAVEAMRSLRAKLKRGRNVRITNKA